MTQHDEPARADILARLSISREEIRRLLDPPRVESNEGSQSGHAGADVFPRSRTLQMLMGGRGLGVMGALAGGLFIARPGLALRLLRLLPTGTVAKMLLAKSLGALREGRNGRDGPPR